MKAIVCSDTHYDITDIDMKRTNDIDETFGEVIDIAIEQKIDLFVHCGDVFDNNRPTADSIALVIKRLNILEENEIETFIIPGNHDIISQAGRTSALAPIEAIPYEHIHVISKPTIRHRNGVTLMFLPHVAKAHIDDENLEDYWTRQIKRMLKKSKDTIIAFAHHNIEGAVSGSEAWMIKGDEQIIPKLLFKDSRVKMLFDGHIHKPQIIKKNKTKVVIVGSVECLNMGEKDEEKQYAIVEVEADGN